MAIGHYRDWELLTKQATKQYPVSQRHTKVVTENQSPPQQQFPTTCLFPVLPHLYRTMDIHANNSLRMEC
jgi:hypothetical protein